MPKRLVDCVKKVKAKGDNVNPYAVCSASTGLKFEHKKKKVKESMDSQTKIIKEFLESKGIEGSQENINEFLSSLARFVGSGAKKVAGATDKFLQKRQHSNNIKSLNKQTMKSHSALKALKNKNTGMSGGSALRSPEALAHIRNQRAATFDRLRAKGYNVGQKGFENKGRFVGKANIQAQRPGFRQKIRRQLESVIKSGETVFEGSLGFRRQVRKNKTTDPINITKLQNKNTTRELRHPSKVKQEYADMNNMGPHRRVGSSISRSQYSGWHGYGKKSKSKY